MTFQYFALYYYGQIDLFHYYKIVFPNLFKKNKIFILGCQRSGTTLLRLILDSHRRIYCYGEINGYAYFTENFRAKHKKKFEGFQLPIWTELFVEYDCIKKYKNLNDKILFIYRDPKEVICSMKSLKIKEKNYIQYEVCSHINTWMNDDSRSFKKTFEKEITSDEIVKAICYWKYKNMSYFKMKELKYDVHLINYKNLVTNPKTEISNILNFLKIEWDESTLCHHKTKHDEINPNNIALGNTKANRKIDKDSLNKWEKILTDYEIKLIEEKTQELLGNLNNNI